MVRLEGATKPHPVTLNGLGSVGLYRSRSQMAASLLDLRAKGTVHVLSAGSAPADSINPAVVEAMAEIGVDLTREFPKPLTDDVVLAADCGMSSKIGAPAVRGMWISMCFDSGASIMFENKVRGT